MKTLYLTLIFSLFFFIGISQENKKVVELVNQGVKLHDKGSYAEAIALYKQALQIDENSPLANYEISYSYFLLPDYDKAISYAEKVLSINKENMAEAYLTIGNSLDMQNKPKEAIDVYQTALSKYQNYLLYYNYALVCYKQNQIDKAENLVIMALNKNFYHASSQSLLSSIMYKKGSRIKAILPLYYFFLLETKTKRASDNYAKLKEYLGQGLNKDDKNNIQITVPNSSTASDSFSAAEMAISLANASNIIEKQKGKSDLELFVHTNETIFNTLGELKKDQTGFWWDNYVSFFYELSQKGFVEPFSYYIAGNDENDNAMAWFDDHKKEFEDFANWLKQK
ncbi:tetratricopeptide repeat protein [Zhouia sp. PK063]|uniref:tetratricopeptide repeat protein n=1 Tax=Zhouia sp. PK063 TaxID=3373602 RepID=UPI00379F1BEB